MVAWLEAERRRTVTTAEVAETLGWPSSRAWQVMHRLARKGWIKRTAKGRYETVLAETGGYAPPNPWAALSTWRRPYYVGFQSAAYERGLTPDRPGDVQACVPWGTRRPRAWHDLPVALIWRRAFSSSGVRVEEVHGWSIALALPEKIVLEGAALPARIGGLPGLARVLLRAHDRIDWGAVRAYSHDTNHGGAALRRLAGLLELSGLPIPHELAEEVEQGDGRAPLYLGERRIYGSRGPLLSRWSVIDNVGGTALREEAEH